MRPERNEGGLPDWAQRERQRDLAWVSENLYIFMPMAKEAFGELGRGAIVVDTTIAVRPAGKGSGGNPFGYFPQATFETGDDEDIKRMVRAYDPAQELVIMLIKSENRVSMYRVGTRPRR
jgi:hypothetical protein